MEEDSPPIPEETLADYSWYPGVTFEVVLSILDANLTGSVKGVAISGGFQI
jgi:hypothetical protein